MESVNEKARQGFKLTEQGVRKFIITELWLSFYKCSPEFFYDPKNKNVYPSVNSCLSRSDYENVIFALNNDNGNDFDNANSNKDLTWDEPLQHDQSMAMAMDMLRIHCARIGYVKNVSILSLDDDHLRLRSQKVERLELSHLRNPKKGYVFF